MKDFGAKWAAVERHTERRILVGSMRQAAGRIRASSARQLPTDHDYDGGLHARSANIRVINRRYGRLDAAHSALEEKDEQR